MGLMGKPRAEGAEDVEVTPPRQFASFARGLFLSCGCGFDPELETCFFFLFGIFVLFCDYFRGEVHSDLVLVSELHAGKSTSLISDLQST
jgi:hypothetical protein